MDHVRGGTYVMSSVRENLCEEDISSLVCVPKLYFKVWNNLGCEKSSPNYIKDGDASPKLG